MRAKSSCKWSKIFSEITFPSVWCKSQYKFLQAGRVNCLSGHAIIFRGQNVIWSPSTSVGRFSHQRWQILEGHKSTHGRYSNRGILCTLTADSRGHAGSVGVELSTNRVNIAFTTLIWDSQLQLNENDGYQCIHTGRVSTKWDFLPLCRFVCHTLAHDIHVYMWVLS